MPQELLGPGGTGMRASGMDYSKPRSDISKARKSAKKQKTKKNILTGVAIGLSALATAATAGAASPLLAAAIGSAGAVGSGLANRAAGKAAQKEATARSSLTMPPNPTAQRDY
tara:strand:- start:6487 stop:6825 length:339 start_codon:yes stop_codon:yes gene_type:complete